MPVLALLAAPTAGQTPYQRYLCLDGVNDYASVADNPSLDLGSGATDDFTIETFFYVPDLTNTTTDTLIWKQGSFGLYVIFRATTPDRFIYRIYTGPGSTDYVYLFADVNLGVGWHHVAAIWDNEATPSWDYLALYVDGALVASSSGLEMTPGILNTTSPLYVAAYAGVNPAIGGFEETRLSSAVRYSGPSYTVPTAPFVSDESTRALWHFDDAPGSTAFSDSSGQGNTLAGSGGAQTCGEACPTIALSPATLPNGVQGAAYSQSLAATGGTGPYGFAVTLGALPPGVTLSSGGLVSGTPTVPGSYAFTVTATDANGCTGAHVYTLVVDCPTIGLSPATLPNGVQGAAYSQSVTAGGGTGPYGFAVTLGALPPGLTLSSGGFVSGTPTVPGSYTFTVTATDANGCTGAHVYTLVVDCPAIGLSPATLPTGVQGAAYSQSLAASGGTEPYGFAVTLGALPPGLTLSSGGLVSGTPSVPGSSTFTVTATDANGCTGAHVYTLVIDCPAIGLSPATLPNGVQGAAYSQSLAASGGTGPYGFAVTLGALPPGLTLSSGGLVSGTPSAPGSSTFTVTATDANGCTGAHVYTLVVDCPTIGLSPATLPNGVQGAAYSQSLTASGGTEPYGFAVTLGALPPGLTLSSGGLVSGTPSAPGSYTFTVTAADANGCTGARAYTLIIVLEADLSLTLSDSPDPVTGTSPLTYTVAVTNTGPNTASTLVVSHTLPAGVAFNSAGGPGWTCGETGGVVTCDRSSLAVGAAPDITVQVTPGPTGTLLVSSASVSAVETDPNPANNSHSVTTTVTGVPYADLGILKTGPTDPVLWGWPVAYVISVTNSGPDTVAGATVTDAFPAAVLAVSWTCAGTGGSFCAASGTGDIDDSTVNLTPGGSVTYTATGVLAWGTMLPVSNTATVSSPIYDPFAANNTSTTSTSVDPDLIFKDGFQ